MTFIVHILSPKLDILHLSLSKHTYRPDIDFVTLFSQIIDFLKSLNKMLLLYQEFLVY